MIIMKLNLDSDFNPSVNLDIGNAQDTITADLFQFSGGEWHIKVNKFRHWGTKVNFFWCRCIST